MSIPVSQLVVGAAIRGVRRSGIDVIKKSIADHGFTKSSFIKCYEVFEEDEVNCDEPTVVASVEEDETLSKLEAHQRWFVEDIETTKKYESCCHHLSPYQTLNVTDAPSRSSTACTG